MELSSSSTSLGNVSRTGAALVPIVVRSLTSSSSNTARVLLQSTTLRGFGSGNISPRRAEGSPKFPSVTVYNNATARVSAAVDINDTHTPKSSVKPSLKNSKSSQPHKNAAVKPIRVSSNIDSIYDSGAHGIYNRLPAQRSDGNKRRVAPSRSNTLFSDKQSVSETEIERETEEVTVAENQRQELMQRELEEEREKEEARRAYETEVRNGKAGIGRIGPSRARLIDRKQATLHSRWSSAVRTPLQRSGTNASKGNKRGNGTAVSYRTPTFASEAKIIGKNKNDGFGAGRSCVITSGADGDTSLLGTVEGIADAQGINELWRSDTENGSTLVSSASNSSAAIDDPNMKEKSLIDLAGLDRRTLTLASVYIDNARSFDSPHHRDDEFSLRLYKWYRSKPAKALFLAIVLVNMLLTYFEEKNVNKLGLAGFELILLLYILGWSVLELYLYPQRMKRSKDKWLKTWRVPQWVPIWRDKWDMLRILILAICILDVFISGFGSMSYRAAKPLRGYFLACYSTDSRAQFSTIMRTISAMVVPFAMLGFLVFVESAIGIVLFHRVHSLVSNATIDSTYFANVFDSFFDSFTLITGSNFPDITFAAIDEYGLQASLYFIFCLVTGLYIASNVIIAFVYSTWRELAVGEYWQKLKKRQANLKRAFKLLVAGSLENLKEEFLQEKTNRAALSNITTKTTGNGIGAAKEIDSKTSAENATQALSLVKWTSLFAFMHKHLSENDAAVLSRVFFLLLTTTSVSYCSEQDFMDLTEHLSSLTSLTSKDAIPAKTTRALRIEAIFERPEMQYARCLIIIGSCISALYAFQFATSSADLYNAWSFSVDFLCAIWLAVEVSLSIYINNWKRFIASPWKKMGLAIASVSLTAKFIIEFCIQPAMQDTTLTVFRAATFFRIIRAFRVPLVLKRFRLGLKTLVRVFAPLTDLFIYMLVVYYTFAVIGMVAFQGLLTSDNPLLADSEFVILGYAKFFSFDSFPNALFTLFHLMAISNFFVTVEAMIIVFGRGAYCYYLAFFFLVCVSALNLVVAFMLETINVTVKNLSLAREEKESDRQQRREAEQWAREMILIEAEISKHKIHEHHTDKNAAVEDECAGMKTAHSGEVDMDSKGLSRVVTVTAPSIGKKKKRQGVFDEDAMRHAEAEANKGISTVDEESVSRIESGSEVEMFRGIGEELVVKNTEHNHAEENPFSFSGPTEPSADKTVDPPTSILPEDASSMMPQSSAEKESILKIDCVSVTVTTPLEKPPTVPVLTSQRLSMNRPTSIHPPSAVTDDTCLTEGGKSSLTAANKQPYSAPPVRLKTTRTPKPAAHQVKSTARMTTSSSVKLN